MHFTVLFTFNDIETCEVNVRLKLGVVPDANVVRNWPEVNPKVWVSLSCTEVLLYGIT